MPEDKSVAESKPSMAWRYIGAMLSEKKDGNMAASLTRVLTVACFVLWAGLAVAEALTQAITVPSTVQFTLWGLLGLKGAKDVTKAARGKGEAE